MPVRIGRRYVIKSAEGGLDVEAAKLRAYQDIADADFVVPKVLDVDPSGRWLSLERLPRFIPIKAIYLSGGRDASAVFRQAGTVLARIHEHSRPEQPWVRALVNPGQNISGRLLLHGDYGFSNIGVLPGPGRPRLVVYDPSPDRINVTDGRTVGLPIDDMVVMMSCIAGRVSVGQARRLVRLPRALLAEAFYGGYASQNTPGCSLDDVVDRSRALLTDYLRCRRHLPGLAAAAVARVATSTLTERDRRSQ